MEKEHQNCNLYVKTRQAEEGRCGEKRWRDSKEAKRVEHSTELSLGSLGTWNGVSCVWSPESQDEKS